MAHECKKISISKTWCEEKNKEQWVLKIIGVRFTDQPTKNTSENNNNNKELTTCKPIKRQKHTEPFIFYHISLSSFISCCSPEERSFTLTVPCFHSELPTNTSLSAFTLAARLNTLKESIIETHKKQWQINKILKQWMWKNESNYRDDNHYYHLSGLLSKTKSTLWPFSLSMVATVAAAPCRSWSRAHTIFRSWGLSSGRSPLSLSNWNQPNHHHLMIYNICKGNKEKHCI